MKKHLFFVGLVFSSMSFELWSNEYDTLEEACLMSCAKSVAFHLEKGDADMINKPGVKGLTPFVICVGLGNVDTARLFLAYEAVDPDIVDGTGRTALHIAIERGNLEAVLLVLRFDPNPSITNAAGQTPFELAQAAGHEEMVEALSNYARSLGHEAESLTLRLHPDIIPREAIEPEFIASAISEPSDNDCPW